MNVKLLLDIDVNEDEWLSEIGGDETRRISKKNVAEGIGGMLMTNGTCQVDIYVLREQNGKLVKVGPAY